MKKALVAVFVLSLLMIQAVSAAEIMLEWHDFEGSSWGNWIKENEGTNTHSFVGHIGGIAQLRLGGAIRRDIDASNCTEDVNWSWKWKVRKQDPDDNFRAQYRFNTTGPWTTILITNSNSFVNELVQIPGSAGKQFQVRYWMETDGDNPEERGKVDNIDLWCNGDDKPDHDVPEFGTFGALAAIGAMGAFAYKRREE